MKILVVDDESSIRDICSQALSGAGYEVRTVVSGEEALPRRARSCWGRKPANSSKLAGVLQPVPVTELICEKLVG